MDIQKLSNGYCVRKLEKQDIEMIFALSEKNEMYYRHCPPFVTRESIEKDMSALPPNKTLEDKHYVGFFKEEKLVAVMDLIEKYPNKETAFIGFFMVDKLFQGVGIGSSIINDCCEYLSNEGYLYIKLGYSKNNSQSKHFWHKNGFEPTGIETFENDYVIVVMQKKL